MQITAVLVVTVLSWIALPAQGKSIWWSSADDHPYEFGFKIDGNQHRKESKDANGIIMGEFGFLTADGVYHVTMYATDENGNYKVLSMKNLKKMELDMVKQLMSAMVVPQLRQSFPPAAAHTPAVVVTPQPFQVISTPAPVIAAVTRKPSNIAACSNCHIPEPTFAPVIEPLSVQKMVYLTTNDGPEVHSPVNRFSAQPQGQINAIQGDQQNNVVIPNGNPNLNIGTPTTGFSGSNAFNQPSQGPGFNAVSGTINDGFENPAQYPNQNQQAAQYPQTPSQNPIQNQGAPQYPQIPSQNPIKNQGASQYQDQGPNRNPNNIQSNVPIAPLLSSAPQGRQLDLNQQTKAMVDILQGLLYKFNYKVGYHGHNEIGDRSGNKEGEYYVIGRDGIKRTVTYRADENGFQPILKDEPVPENETPREETEKEAGLKEYEFKWFYMDEQKK